MGERHLPSPTKIQREACRLFCQTLATHAVRKDMTEQVVLFDVLVAVLGTRCTSTEGPQCSCAM